MSQCTYHFVEPKNDDEIAREKIEYARKMRILKAKREQQERDEKRKILAEEKRRREEARRIIQEIEELSMATTEWTTRSAEVMTNYALLSNSEKMNLLQDAKRTTAWKTSKNMAYMHMPYTSICIDTGIFLIAENFAEICFTRLSTVRRQHNVSNAQITKSPIKTAICILQFANSLDRVNCIIRED